jgi:hypothetical protein
MRILTIVKKEILGADPILTLALVLSFIFCLHGITTKFMHPDQMAFVPLFHEGELPFNPKWFEKPPFHTYFNYFLSVLPVSFISTALNLPPDLSDFSRKVWSRLLTSFLFLGSIVLVFHITRKSFGVFPARVIILIFATSAGFVAHSHFLTADIPVMFWMMVACYFSHNILSGGKVSDYALAGFFTGIATATKYNGLAVGITIVVAHLLFLASPFGKRSTWKQIFFGRKLLLGLVMVVVGFVIGNPFSLLDYQTFKADFIYNSMVAPVYEGQIGHSYGKFFSRMIEIIGLPSFLALSIAVASSFSLVLLNKEQHSQRAVVLLYASAFLLYYWKFGSFPRLETRFVLPIMPLWFIMSGPFWHALRQQKAILPIVLLGILGYNLICCFYVGKRFLDDPRIPAETWVQENVPPNSSIESDIYSPGWNNIPGVQVRETTMPFVSGRERLFERLFKGNPFVVGSEDDRRKAEQAVKWYSLAELMKRNPDFLAVNSLYYRRFIEQGIIRELYPSMAEFFQDLFDEQYSYKIAFDKESKTIPAWIYPRDIDFLHNRATIFARKN